MLMCGFILMCKIQRRT